jgi:DME family drug/metabolite transporter
MTSHSTTPSRRGLASIAAAAIAWGTGGTAAVILHRDYGLGPFAVSFWRFALAVAAVAVTRAAAAALETVRRKAASSRRGSTNESPHGSTGRSTCGSANESPHGSTGRSAHGSAGATGDAADPEANAVPRGRQIRPGGALLTGFGLALSQAAYFAACDRAGVALSTLITLGASPVLIATGARVTLAEPLSRKQISALGVALAGLCLLATGSSAGHPDRPAAGIALAFLSAVAYSMVTLLARAGRAGRADLPVFAVGAGCLAPAALAEGPLPHASGAAPLLVFLGVVPTWLAYRWFFQGLSTVRAATASVVALLEPVTAAIVAVTLLGERLTVATMLAGGLLTGSVLAMARAG